MEEGPLRPIRRRSAGIGFSLSARYVGQVRTIVFLACLLGFLSSARADDVLPAPGHLLDPTADTAEVVEFIAFVALGDRERRAGRIPEAAMAYAKAIRLQRDPVILGRLGVLLVKLEQYTHAADVLHEALQLANTTPQEREEFFRAHEIARQHGAWVDVTISHVGALVTLDGAPRNPKRLSGFTVFLLNGRHQIRASLDGYEDVSATFTVEPAKHQVVTLNFVTSRFPALPALQAKNDSKVTQPPLKPSSNIVGDPNYSSKEDPFYVSLEEKKAREAEKQRPSRGSIYAGPTVVFGVASWYPAVGAVIGGAWKPSQYFSLGLEGRAAWLTVGVADEPISAMTGGGTASACGHLKWFFGCALGHVGVMRGEFDSESFIGKVYVSPKVGGGARVGAQLRLSQSFSLTGTIDGLVLNSGIRVDLEGRVLVDQPPFMLGSSVLSQWEFP